MKFLHRISFAIVTVAGVLTLYSYTSGSLPVQSAFCLGGERFVVNSAFRGLKQDHDGHFQVVWERWVTPKGEVCDDPGNAIVATDPGRTA